MLHVNFKSILIVASHRDAGLYSYSNYKKRLLSNFTKKTKTDPVKIFYDSVILFRTKVSKLFSIFYAI